MEPTCIASFSMLRGFKDAWGSFQVERTIRGMMGHHLGERTSVLVGFGSKWSQEVSECIGFNARKPWGLAGVVSGRNDSARVEGDDNSSSRW